MNCHFCELVLLSRSLPVSKESLLKAQTSLLERAWLALHYATRGDAKRILSNREIAKVKCIPIFKDTCINYNNIGYSCILFLKIPK